MYLTKENFLLNQKLIYCFWDCEINNETPFMTRGLHWKVLILKLERLLSNSTDLMFTRSCWVKIEQQTPSPDSRDNPWLDYLALPYIAPALGVNIQIASESKFPSCFCSPPDTRSDLNIVAVSSCTVPFNSANNVSEWVIRLWRGRRVWTLSSQCLGCLPIGCMAAGSSQCVAVAVFPS